MKKKIFVSFFNCHLSFFQPSICDGNILKPSLLDGKSLFDEYEKAKMLPLKSKVQILCLKNHFYMATAGFMYQYLSKNVNGLKSLTDKWTPAKQPAWFCKYDNCSASIKPLFSDMVELRKFTKFLCSLEIDDEEQFEITVEFLKEHSCRNTKLIDRTNLSLDWRQTWMSTALSIRNDYTPDEVDEIDTLVFFEMDELGGFIGNHYLDKIHPFYFYDSFCRKC